MQILLIILILFFTFHAIYNLINYYRYEHIENLLYGNYSNDTEAKNKAKIHKGTILNYIKYSGIKDFSIPITQPTGYNQIVNGNASIFNNLLNTRSDFSHYVINMLLEAKGNYWSRFINTFNPIYWIRIILHIPTYVLTYLGIKSDSIFIKIFQLIYWLLGIIFTFLITIFPNEIKAFIFSLLHIS